MPRFLAIDYGTKRIGLAVGDLILRIASPLDTLTASGRVEDDVRVILAKADEYAVDAYVLGLPLNMDDTEGAQAKATRQFGDLLKSKSGKPVYYQDERLSSFAADELLRDGDFTRKGKKSRQDRVAAQVFLQAFLEQLPKV